MCESINKKNTFVGQRIIVASIALLLTPVDSIAETVSSHDAFYLNASAYVAVGKDNEEHSELYRHGGGFHLSEGLDLGIADVYLGNESGASSTRGAEIYLRRLAAVGEQAQLYVDAGVTTFGDHFSMGAGMLYALNDHLDVDVGYRYYADASTTQGDVYSFGLGLQYNFADRAITTMGEPEVPPVQARRVVKSEPEVITRVVKSEPEVITRVVKSEPEVITRVVKSEPEVITRVVKSEPEVITRVVKSEPEVITRVVKSEPEVITRVVKSDLNQSGAFVCPRIWRSPGRFIDNPQQTTVRYVIQKGDWVIKVARRHCTTLDVLIALNPWLSTRVANHQYIYPGEILTVPSFSE